MEEIELKGPDYAILAACLLMLAFLLAVCVVLFCLRQARGEGGMRGTTRSRETEIDMQVPSDARMFKYLRMPLAGLFVLSFGIFMVIIGLETLVHFFVSWQAVLYGLYLLAVLLLSIVICWTIRFRWVLESRTLRQTVLACLCLPRTADSLAEARARILALVPCYATKLQGLLAGMPVGQRLWLCFLADRLLIVSGRSGEVVDLPRSELSRMYLLDFAGATKEQRLALETEGMRSLLIVDRMDDVARIVNVLVRWGMILRYASAKE